MARTAPMRWARSCMMWRPKWSVRGSAAPDAVVVDADRGERRIHLALTQRFLPMRGWRRSSRLLGDLRSSVSTCGAQPLSVLLDREVHDHARALPDGEAKSLSAVPSAALSVPALRRSATRAGGQQDVVSCWRTSAEAAVCAVRAARWPASTRYPSEATSLARCRRGCRRPIRCAVFRRRRGGARIGEHDGGLEAVRAQVACPGAAGRRKSRERGEEERRWRLRTSRSEVVEDVEVPKTRYAKREPGQQAGGARPRSMPTARTDHRAAVGGDRRQRPRPACRACSALDTGRSGRRCHAAGLEARSDPWRDVLRTGRGRHVLNV